MCAKTQENVLRLFCRYEKRFLSDSEKLLFQSVITEKYFKVALRKEKANSFGLRKYTF
jgi:hypothetical protein